MVGSLMEPGPALCLTVQLHFQSHSSFLFVLSFVLQLLSVDFSSLCTDLHNKWRMTAWKNKCFTCREQMTGERLKSIASWLSCSKPFQSNTFRLPVPKRMVLFSIFLFLRRIEDWVGCTCVQTLPFINSSISVDRNVSFISLIQSRVILMLYF